MSTTSKITVGGTEYDLRDADAQEQLTDVKTALGTNPPILTPLEYTTVVSKYFRNGATYSTIDDAILSASTEAWRYGYCPVEAGKTYRCTFQLRAGTEGRMFIMYGDSSGNWIGAGYREPSGASDGLVTVDVTIPENVTTIYVSSYTSAANQPSRLIIQSVTYDSAFDQISDIKSDVSDLQDDTETLSEMMGIFRHDVRVDKTMTMGSMNTATGGINASNEYMAHTSIFAIYEPVLIKIPTGYVFSVNQYDNLITASTGRFVKNLVNNATGTVIITSETYPAFNMFAFNRVDVAKITQSDITAMQNGLIIRAASDQPLFASPSMFPKWAITGCSWDAGSIYNVYPNDGNVTQTGLGWAENVSRRNGLELKNYGIGATSIRTWFNYDTGALEAHSFKQLLTDNSSPLYILTFGGTNDRNAEIGFVVNDSGYSPETPSSTKYYVGSIEDISTRSAQGYTSYPCTFYGYYGRIIEMIKAHAPYAFIIVTSPNTQPAGNAIDSALVTACQEIAEYYDLPYMDITKDPYYPVYISHLAGNHPTAVTYSGWAMAFERLFANCVEKNAAYFDKWGGYEDTQPVTWSKVELPT